jgi:hypothetical protein
VYVKLNHGVLDSSKSLTVVPKFFTSKEMENGFRFRNLGFRFFGLKDRIGFSSRKWNQGFFSGFGFRFFQDRV